MFAKYEERLPMNKKLARSPLNVFGWVHLFDQVNTDLAPFLGTFYLNKTKESNMSRSSFKGSRFCSEVTFTTGGRFVTPALRPF